MTLNFDDAFRILTGHQPFAWQRRLYDDFCAGKLPAAIELPTGMGKMQGLLATRVHQYYFRHAGR